MGFNHLTSRPEGHSEPEAEPELDRALVFLLPTPGNFHYPKLSPRNFEMCEHSWAFAP